MRTLLTSSAKALGLSLSSTNLPNTNQEQKVDFSSQKLSEAQLAGIKGGDDDILIADIIGG